MQADLIASMAAICLYPLLLVIPGYVIAWMTDLFDFRRRTPAFRFALSIPLSISALPILIYLIGRFVSIYAVAGALAVSWIAFSFLLVRGKVERPHVPAIARWIVLAWLGISLFTSVDLQIGARDYYPVTAFDYAVRSEFIHSIATTGIPPVNPFFFPGHAVPMRYHYFWLLLPSSICRASGYAITPRAAWIGSVFWSGLGFLCLTAVALRVFWHRGAESFPRRAIAGILLLGITGLDIVPTALLWLLRANGMLSAVFPSMEWWNEQVDGFGYTALWEAHHLAGLTACITAFLLIQEGAQRTTPWRRVCYAVVAGLALATAAGASIHIAFVFAVYLLVWTAIVVMKRWWRLAAVLVIAGAIGMALAIPYGLSLRSAGAAQGTGRGQGIGTAGGPLLQFWVRPFHPAEALCRILGLGGAGTLRLVDTLALPLNYFLELGFFFAAAIAWWRRRRAARKPLSQPELAVAVLVATSILICTFLRSSLIGNNDLGWRGFLLAQFGLLLWSVDVLFDQPRKRFLTVLVVLGALGSAYEVAIVRFYPVLADAGLVATRSWMAPDRQLGARNYSAREAYEWIAQSTPPDAVIQFDPPAQPQDTSAFLYSRRQIAAADVGCMAPFGGDSSLCPPLISMLANLYPRRGKPAAVSLHNACQTLPVDILVAKDTDAAWADRHGWVWTERPVFANRYFRVFRCRGNTGRESRHQVN